MATPSNTVQASNGRGRALGVLLAGGILFVIGIGGSGVLSGASGGAGVESTIQSNGAA